MVPKTMGEMPFYLAEKLLLGCLCLPEMLAPLMNDAKNAEVHSDGCSTFYAWLPKWI